jgi:hypothetical protein
VGQIVAVDGRVQDPAEQAHVAVDGGGLEPIGDQPSSPGTDLVGVQGGEGDAAEGGQDALLDTLARLVGRVGMLSFQVGHHTLVT